MDAPITPQAAPQVVQVRHKQGRIPLPLTPGDQQPTRTAVQGAGQMALVVVPGGYHFTLLSARHPARADFRVQVDVHLILKDHRLVLRQLRQQRAETLDFLGILRVAGAHDGTRPTPDIASSVLGTSHGLRTRDRSSFCS
jgi:hypothetical protein